MQASRVGLLYNQELESILHKDPVLGISLLKIMASRLREAQDKISNLALYDVERRIIATLLRLSEDYGLSCPQDCHVKLRLTNQEIAGLAGTSRETANRILNDLRRRKLIDLEPQHITIFCRRRLLELL